MFHHIAEVCPKGVNQSCYSSISDFRELICNLAKTKQFVSISEICNELNIGVVPSDKVVITFDDVPSNVYSNAIPILREFRVPYTLYISTNLIGSEGYLSKEQITILARDPLCTIGSHTVSHCMLKEKGINVLEELSKSKTILEKIIERPVEHFAYPYGTPFAISKAVIKQVAISGLYKSAVCTIPAYINKYSIENMYSLPRIHSQLFMNKYF